MAIPFLDIFMFCTRTVSLPNYFLKLASNIFLKISKYILIAFWLNAQSNSQIHCFNLIYFTDKVPADQHSVVRAEKTLYRLPGDNATFSYRVSYGLGNPRYGDFSTWWKKVICCYYFILLSLLRKIKIK